MGTENSAWLKDLPRFGGALLLPLLAGGVGGVATSRNVVTWYPTLKKPAFNPPNWIFGPVWTTLYLLMGVAHYLVLREQAEPGVARLARIFYGLQLVLNTLWSLLFFGRRSPLASLVENRLSMGSNRPDDPHVRPYLAKGSTAFAAISALGHLCRGAQRRDLASQPVDVQ